MGRLRRIAEIPAGSWTKWVVVAFWLIVLVLAFPLSSKLTGAEKNNASAWLPGSAESTKVLDVQSRFQSPNIYTGVVVYVQSVVVVWGEFVPRDVEQDAVVYVRGDHLADWLRVRPRRLADGDVQLIEAGLEAEIIVGRAPPLLGTSD